MTDFPRWERESREDLQAPAPHPDQTVEFDMAAAGLVEPAELSDPPEYEPEAEPRLAAARESFHASLSATRQTARDSLSSTRDSLSSTGETIASTAGRVGRWLHSLDRRPEYGEHLGRDPIAELTAGDQPPAVEPDGPERSDANPGHDHEPDSAGRFATAPLGYNRHAVDRHIAALEDELDRLRAVVDPPPPSINEEIERLGEQTASILVVAHDKAHETARWAQEQAMQAVTDATRDAERITTEAERRLRELDEETDAVWRERERLLDDVRGVSRSLATLAEEAGERFPAAEARVPEPAASVSQ